MKGMRFLLAVALLAGLAVAANAADAPDQIAQKFKTADEYLKANNLQKTTSADEVLAGDYILVVGEGAPKAGTQGGQKRLTAIRAAEVVAYRLIGELLDGVAVVGATTVKDSALESDEIRTAMAAFVKGAQAVYSGYNEADGVATVVMKVGRGGPRGYGELLYGKLVGDPVVKKKIEATGDPKGEYKPSAPPAAGAAEEKFDGLILDATEVSFRPALMNRVFTQKGEVVYDPSKISQKVLVEQGCGEYTNSVDKAKAALGARGVKNPLVVKAVGTASASDLQVSDDDALKIYTAGQKEPFLSGAKVAFVLK